MIREASNFETTTQEKFAKLLHGMNDGSRANHIRTARQFEQIGIRNLTSHNPNWDPIAEPKLMLEIRALTNGIRDQNLANSQH